MIVGVFKIDGFRREKKLGDGSCNAWYQETAKPPSTTDLGREAIV